MNMEDLDELEEKFTELSNQALTQFAKPYICRALYDAGTESAAHASEVLDMIYAECTRRGIEKLYDMTYEVVSRNPDTCSAA